MSKALGTTAELGLKPDRAGKVRDVFDLGDRLLIVSTDRLSAYDVVLPTRLPGKGVLLTQITLGGTSISAARWRRTFSPLR